MRDADFSLDELNLIGCNGTVTNMGWKLVLSARLRNKLKEGCDGEKKDAKVCLIHFNELPLRHVFQALYGETIGPKLFSGPTSTQLRKCEKLPIMIFESIQREIPSID